MHEALRIELHDGVALITFNRPEVRNAINAEVAIALETAIRDAQSMGCIVITGVDPAFCAGLDLRTPGVASLSDMPSFSQALRRSEVPLIAAVNGAAVTGGLEIALGCDFIYASDRATFADTHLRVGVYPGPVLVDLPRRVGMAWAREMSLTGSFVDAQTALRIGLVNRVMPHGELLDFTMDRARTIAGQDRRMVQVMRSDWDASMGLPIAAARDVHRHYIDDGGFRAVPTPGLATHFE